VVVWWPYISLSDKKLGTQARDPGFDSALSPGPIQLSITCKNGSWLGPENKARFDFW